MRIALATDWFPPRRGGIEAQLHALAAGLAGRGHIVDVITSTPGARTTPGAGYTVRPLPVATLPGADVAVGISTYTALSRALRGYDVVHAHISVVSPVGYLAALAARRARQSVVVTFHSVLHLSQLLLRAGARLSGGVGQVHWSAVSQRVAAQAGRALGTHVALLPNGVDLAFWGSAAPEPRDGVVTIVSAHRLHRKKRSRALLDAFVHAATRARTPARLILVGDGPEEPALRRAATHWDGEPGAGRPVVELRGWQDAATLRALYAQADAFALASRHEAFGIAALEARAAGLPVVAMRASGSAEFLEHERDALLCDDDADLALALERLIDDRATQRRLARGATPLARYDWSEVLRQHETAYANAMSR